MTNTAILNKKATEAVDEFRALTYEERMDVILALAKQLDEKYVAQHTFKAENWDVLDADLKVTYTMYVKGDEPSDIIADCLADEIEAGNVSEDETLADFIENVLDGRIQALPDEPYEYENRDSIKYYPEEILRALGDSVMPSQRTKAMQDILDKTHVEYVKDAEARDGSRLEVWSGWPVIDGIEYKVNIYVRPDLVEGNDDQGNWPWDEFECDIHFNGMAD